VDFYTNVLTFEKETDREVAGDAYEHLFGVFGMRLRVVRMRLGDEHVELMQFLAPRGRPTPADARSNDRWFQHIAIIVSDMDQAYERLRRFKVEHASSGPQRLPDWNPNAGGIEAFYFRDPDGNHLEILEFPAGKGAEKWHRPAAGRLFLGIDHTAIVVADTTASLHFYRDTLGLKVAGTSENSGTEQEHLNNVFGAHLAITALRAPEGPGVEFLEYLAPRGGRPIPPDTLASDDWYWQINLRVDDADAIAPSLDSDAGSLQSSGVTQTDGALGFTRGVIVRDADGHASLLATEH
jgi:catechol 2,3-dioxygenase-like lactoylglutathione lyase family enzyme